MSELRVNTIVAAEGTSAPNLPYGMQLPIGYGITGAGGLNITGIITAANFDGTLTGAAGTFSGIVKITDTTESAGAANGALVVSGGAGVAKNLHVGDSLLTTKDLTVGAAATIVGALSGSTGTFSGAVNVDATTDSTSTTTGALIVDGGAAIAKNVYIGAGLSVAGTLTYEDVTNVDSVGVITAKSGVNISGGELLVGSNIKGGTAGVLTATTFVGALTGNVTGNLIGNATSGLSVSGGEFKVGTAVTIAATAGVATFSQDVFFHGANDTKYVQWDASSNKLLLKDGAYLGLGNAGNGDLQLYHDGSDSIINNATGDLKIYVKDGEKAIICKDDEGVELYYNNQKQLETTNDGFDCTGIGTFQSGLAIQGMMKEEFYTVANKLSAGTNIDVASGMIWYYSTNETTTATPNIRYSSAKTLNNMVNTGESLTVTIIYKPNGAGYYASLQVDGSGVTEEWLGGSAPSSANAGGYDILTHTLLKTGASSWICLSNVQNFA